MKTSAITSMGVQISSLASRLANSLPITEEVSFRLYVRSAGRWSDICIIDDMLLSTSEDYMFNYPMFVK